MNKLVSVGRIALRQQGEWWVAYYAAETTMEGAIELARVAIRLVGNEPRRQQFMQLARDLFADLSEEAIGQRPHWPEEPHPAPEHERAGHS